MIAATIDRLCAEHPKQARRLRLLRHQGATERGREQVELTAAQRGNRPRGAPLKPVMRSPLHSHHVEEPRFDVVDVADARESLCAGLPLGHELLEIIRRS